MRYTGKSVVVTGAAAGIGAQIALDYIKEGATVIAVDINEDGLKRLSDRAKEYEGTLYEYTGDISLQETNEAMIDFAVEKTGKIDILVNNAGVAGRFEPIGDITNELWQRVLKVNLQAPMFSMRKAVQVMLLQKDGGNIVNIASVAGIRTGQSGVAYTTAKHGLIGMSQNTAYMYLKNNIRCNVVAPGGIKTSIIEAYPDDNPFGRDRIYGGAGRDNGAQLGEPEDISAMVRFITSDEAKHITGSVFVVDGGASSY
ncbi:MAG: SDR family oxidoreductase [Lachnospiraceae bacterium]